MAGKTEKLLLLVNPSAGNGKSIDMLADVEQKFFEIGADVDIRITENIKQAKEIAFIASRRGYNRIIAMGGDGTVNAVAGGILGSDSTLAVIPSGTGNDFFKLLKIENKLENICRAAAFNKAVELDAGIINDRPFFNMLGVGFDAEVAIEANKMKGNLGVLTYLSAVLKVWKRFPVFDIRLRIDNLELEKQVMLVAVGIGRSTGGGFLLTPYALANDGKFDVCVVQRTNRRRIFSILPKVMKGTHVRQPETKIYRCRQVEISSKSALPIHYEGETFVHKNGRLSVKMSPNKIRVAAGEL